MKYHDSYVGGKYFSGSEVLYVDDITYYSMNYYGRVLNEDFSSSFLKECLSLVSNEYCYRGPLFYKNKNYVYVMNVVGDFKYFKGEENIYFKNKLVYTCTFHGGIIK